jgi:hypothetical protein
MPAIPPVPAVDLTPAIRPFETIANFSTMTARDPEETFVAHNRTAGVDEFR